MLPKKTNLFCSVELQWKKLWQRKPDITKMHPSDIEAIQNAEETVGDFKLKSAPDYRVPKHLRMSTVNKYDELLNVRERVSIIFITRQHKKTKDSKLIEIV